MPHLQFGSFLVLNGLFLINKMYGGATSLVFLSTLLETKGSPLMILL